MYLPRTGGFSVSSGIIIAIFGVGAVLIAAGRKISSLVKK